MLMQPLEVHPIPGFTEPFCALSHLGGAVVFAVLSACLLRRAWGDAPRFASLSVFAFSTVLLLSLSGVYHMLPWESTGRSVLLRLDKAAIFVLIAGTHTPVQVSFFHGVARWGVLLLMWSVAATGITLFSIFADELPAGLGTTAYLLLGWIAGFSGIVVWRRYGFSRVRALVAGGIFYSVGAVFLGCNWPTAIPRVVGPHELWHVAVLIALGFHWHFMLEHARDRG